MSAMDVLRAEAVGDWQVCGDCFYSRELLCSMQWEDQELEDKRLCSASFAGPVAVVRDERRMVVVTGGTVEPVVRIFTASGGPLGSFVWETGARLLEWGWTSQLHLACVEPGAMVVLRSLAGEKVREFSLGSVAAGEGLIAAAVAGSAVVGVTRALSVWAVEDVAAPRPIRLATPPIDADLAPTCKLVVLPPSATLSGNLEVLLVAGPGSVVYRLDLEGYVEHPLALQPPSPPVMMRLSPCGAFLALLTADGRLLVMPTDMSRKLSEFETHADAVPVAMEWCGSDAVVLQWRTLLLVVGPYGDHVSWATPDESVVLVPEVDGVRVVGSTRHELIRKLPEPLAEVFRPGSTSPATQLWDARALLDAGNARADKLLRELGSALPEAVSTCTDAAGAELEPARQKALLRAAAYGRTFCGPSFPAHSLSVAAHTLRLLSAVRDPRVGLPLTTRQLQGLGVPALLARLVLYQQWLLAYRIAGNLMWAPPQLLASAAGASRQPNSGAAPAPSTPGLQAPALQSPVGALSALAAGEGPGSSPVSAAALQQAIVGAWACARISAAARGVGAQAVPDAQLKEQLMAKLKTCQGVRYAPLAAHAQSVGRRRLALLLLEEETSCALQVPLLLSLATGQPNRTPKATGEVVDSAEVEADEARARALRRAIESGDTDLVMAVLFHAYRTQPLADFWQLVSSRALARNLFVKYCKAREPALLETLLTTTGQATELAELKMTMALYAWTEAQAAHVPGDEPLSALIAGLTTAASKYSMSRDHAFHSKAASDLAALRRAQAKLEAETGQHLLVGLTLQASLQELIRLGHHKQAAALRKQFGVGDKQFWWLKLRCLAEGRAWDALDAFAAEKKSPVGYEPFLEVAKRFGAPPEVQARLIARLPDSTAKAEAYTGIGMAREAAEVAARLKDGDLLRRIGGMVSSASPAGLAIAQMKERLGVSSS